MLKVIPENLESDQQESGKQKFMDEKGKNKISYTQMMIYDACAMSVWLLRRR